MGLEPMTGMLQRAKAEKYAIGQININGLLWIQAVLDTAQKNNSPVILGASDRLVDYLGGFKTIVGMVKNMIEELDITIPVALHLDHGSSVDRCIQAIDAGFSSVMYDGSHLPIDENIHNTSIVVEYARRHGVSVEAEVGSVGGMEDGLVGGIRYAKLEECERLVKEAKIDALAAALGSVHGKYSGEPKLGFKEMEEISESVNIPLVLHGASGIPLHQLKKAIHLGHAKVNYNTEVMTAWRNAIRLELENNPDIVEPKLINAPGYTAIATTVSKVMSDLGSVGKALE